MRHEDDYPIHTPTEPGASKSRSAPRANRRQPTAGTSTPPGLGLLLCVVLATTSSVARTEGSEGFKLRDGDTLEYFATLSNGRLKIEPHAASGVVASIKPQVSGAAPDADHLAGGIRLYPDAGSTAGVSPKPEPSRSVKVYYAGAFESRFVLLEGGQQLVVEYPHSDVVLDVSLTVSDRRVELKSAIYSGGCEGGISSRAQKYLDRWVEQLRQGVVVPRGQYLELLIPDASQKAPLDPGERESMSHSCASVAGARYYDLTIESVPALARVYVDGRYIGLTGTPMKVAGNPASVLIRHAKCEDFAKSVPLQDGPNVVQIALGGCKP